MRFAIFTTLFAYATIGLVQLVSASPILDTKDMVRRDNSDIMAAMTTLKGNVDPILAQIKELGASNQTSIETLTPLLTQLKSALDNSAADLSAMSVASLRKRQTDDELANLVAGIVNDIVDALQGLVAELSTIPLLAGLLAGIDVSLNQVLLGLGILLKGVLNLVANLLTNVAQLLRDLAFGLSLGTLGL